MVTIEESAEKLYKAMKGLGTDDSGVINVICQNTKSQRQLLKKAYLTMYGKKLEEDLNSDLSGNYLKCILALIMPTEEFEAKCLRDAMKGIGCDVKKLIEILCTKEGPEIKQLAEVYKRMYNRNLEEDVGSEVSGDIGRLLRSLACAGREKTNYIDQSLVAKDAEAFYKAGQGKLGTDEVEFVRILCSRSYAHLKELFEVYYIKYKTDIEKAIAKETSGDFEKGLLAIVRSIRNKPKYFADLLYYSMKGLGTNDDQLIRIIAMRSEVDLHEIKQEFKRAHGKSLQDWIKGDTSGNYQKLLLTLVGKD